MVIWGLSATLGNLEEASDVLLGGAAAAATQDTAGATRTTRITRITRAVGTSGEHRSAALLHGRVDRPLVIDTLLPANPGRFSWAGHLGARMLAPLVDELESCSTALVFTNTRSQAETWFRLLLEARPDWAGVIALHHGSLDKAARAWVDAAQKAGELKVVVATSSLDLGVDFLPVERVLQIGSAKGVARLLQRAGRSGHQPGRVSRITLVPTNTMELVEAAAARTAALAGRIEARKPPERPLDVLVQHLVTVALGGGFERAAMLAEVRTTHAYLGRTSEQFRWALDFVEGGGASLGAYPDYHRVVNVDGVHRVPDRGIARRHRLAIGTIVGDAAMLVKWVSGGSLGSLEESFIARLKKGDCLVFGGRVLEYVRSHDMAAYVRKATGNKGVVPSWAGGKMPLSNELADAVLERLQAAVEGDFSDPEMRAAEPMLSAQARLSKLPTPHSLLVERFDSREGPPPLRLPVRGSTRSHRPGLAAGVAARPRAGQQLQHLGQ